ALARGGFHESVDPLAAEHGIARGRAHRFEVEAGLLTGGVSGPSIDRAAKAHWLRAVAAEAGIPPEHTVAVGDGANDLDMLDAAGLGIAYRAKPAVAARADRAITGGGLEQVLELIGA